MFKTDIKQIFTPEDSKIIISELNKSKYNFSVCDDHGDKELSVYEMSYKDLKEGKIKDFINKKISDLSHYLKEDITEVFFLKYVSDTNYNKMDAHFDGATRTALVYLNNDFVGGETKFTFTGYEHKPQEFKSGHALIYNSNSIFSHHEGMKVESGIKWVLVCRSLKFTPLRILYFIPYRLFRDFLLDRIILRLYFFFKDIFIKKK